MSQLTISIPTYFLLAFNSSSCVHANSSSELIDWSAPVVLYTVFSSEELDMVFASAQTSFGIYRSYADLQLLIHSGNPTNSYKAARCLNLAIPGLHHANAGSMGLAN